MWHHSYISYLSIQSISTHTSRVGCDFSAPSSTPTITYFYSHIPCGMWLWKGGRNFVKHDFYSHIPCGMWPSSRIFSIASPTISTHTSRVGCDLHCQTCITCSYISTHTSRVGCDRITRAVELRRGNFYSHIPCGMWHSCEYKRKGTWRFLLTHPVWDVTLNTAEIKETTDNFYSHIPCGMWPLYIVYFNHIIPIYYRMDL